VIQLRMIGREDALVTNAPSFWRVRDLAAVLTRELGTGWEIHAVPRRPSRFRSGCRA